MKKNELEKVIQKKTNEKKRDKIKIETKQK